MTEPQYAASTPSPTDTFPSPLPDPSLDLSLHDFEKEKSKLYGPASLMDGEAIMVPFDQSDPELQQQSKQAKHQEVEMLSNAARLPLHSMDKWDYEQKMTWMKCMLTRHLPQPKPDQQHLAERMKRLQAVESEINDRKDEPLKSYIDVFNQYFDTTVSDKLYSELSDWREVCDTFHSMHSNSIFSMRLMPPAEKIVGDHLWEHILRLLMNQDPTVEWLDMKTGLFRFVNSSDAARSWGMTKGNQNMSYEKMSRSIRQYYTEGKNGIIQKAVEFPKLHYRFNMFHLEVVNFLRKNFLMACQDDRFLLEVVNSVC